LDASYRVSRAGRRQVRRSGDAEPARRPYLGWVSPGYVETLVVIVVVVLGARALVAGLPLRWASRLGAVDAGLLAVGIVGLAVHCGAMFFRSRVTAVPATSRAVDMINALGRGSIVWYAASAALVVVGLRGQHPLALAAAGLMLVAVGVTMYDGGPLDSHLASIFAAVVVLAGIAAALVRPPWRSRDPA